MAFTDKLAAAFRQDIDISQASPEDQESLLSSPRSEKPQYVPDEAFVASSSRLVRRLVVLAASLIVLLIISLVFSIVAWTKWNTANLDVVCYQHTSAFPSPMDRDVPPHYDIYSVNGSLKKETIYRMPGSPEVDAAWDRLGAHLLPFAIPEDEGPSYGLLPGQVKRVPEQGGGYVAILESTHHIHCLNVMRQASHWDYDYYRAGGRKVKNSVFSGPEDIVRLHFTHCMDMLRQRLMCDADAAPLGQVWLDGYGPLVFDTVKRKCRNYEKLVDWAKEREMPPGRKSVSIRQGDIVYHEWP